MTNGNDCRVPALTGYSRTINNLLRERNLEWSFIIRLWWRSSTRIAEGIQATFFSDHTGEWIITISIRTIEISKLGVLANEFQFHILQRTVTVLGNDYFGHALCWHTFLINSDLIIFRTIQEHYDIRVLFNRSRFT